MKRVTTKVFIVLHLLELLGRLRFIFRSAVAGRRDAFFTSFGAFQSHNYAVTFCHKNDRLSAHAYRFKADFDRQLSGSDPKIDLQTQSKPSTVTFIQ
jgi:hypothetical protein